jgi:7,8-dihydropterin-6-yl-methyl-4-(beta-D-ribofuranosyl)aminobenzene 5'-phosphate synthase
MLTPEIEVITLVENLAYQQGTKGEHGLSFLVRTGGKQILFDTGQSGLLIQNAKKMNVDLSDVDAVVISHGHYDHTGGLPAFFELNGHAPVWLKSNALDEKMSKSTGTPRFIGIDKEVAEQYSERFRIVSEVTEIAPGLIIVPEINHYYNFEQPSQSMLIRHGNEVVADLFEDELFMVYKHQEGLVVFSGCAHRGIGNICRSAMEQTSQQHIRLVLGGTHLKGASKGRVAKTVKAFQELEVQEFGLCHCTGLRAFKEFANVFGEQVRYAHVASRFLPFD